MEQHQFTARDKPNAQDLNNQASVAEKKYGPNEAKRVSELISALPDNAVEISVVVSGKDVTVSHAQTERVSSDGVHHTAKEDHEHGIGRVSTDGVRHTAKDDLEHGFGPFTGQERRGSGKDNGSRRRSTD